MSGEYLEPQNSQGFVRKVLNGLRQLHDINNPYFNLSDLRHRANGNRDVRNTQIGLVAGTAGALLVDRNELMDIQASPTVLHIMEHGAEGAVISLGIIAIGAAGGLIIGKI